jgi:hypothetical protein
MRRRRSRRSHHLAPILRRRRGGPPCPRHFHRGSNGPGGVSADRRLGAFATYPALAPFIEIGEQPEGAREAEFNAARFRDDDESRAWADRLDDAFVRSISVPELEALNTYAGAGYLRLNSALRARRDLPQEWEDLLPLLDSATYKAILDRDVVLFRGSAASTMGVMALESLVGTIIRDRGFVSTSIDPHAAEDFVRDQPDPLVFEILARGGQRVAFIGGIEREVLLPRELRFGIVRFHPFRMIGEHAWPTLHMEIIQ